MMALARTGEDALLQSAVCLIAAPDVALQAVADPHAAAEERKAANAHAGTCVARLRRIDALLTKRAPGSS